MKRSFCQFKSSLLELYSAASLQLLIRPLAFPEHSSGDVQNPLDDWRSVTTIRRSGNGRAY
ncbi:hypothetical protein J6590_041030 [Homalodisca vitripennis]|nr:hypothetical protein J6590_041030 [Homalodisca vitripennis]